VGGSMAIKVEKKMVLKENHKSKTKKKVDWLKLDEKTQPIPCIEWPIGALEGVGSSWP
jgi:hypothetical protein